MQSHQGAEANRPKKAATPRLSGLLRPGAELLASVLRFEHPADATVARFFRAHPGLGPRERGLLADAVFAVLRHRRRLERLTQGGPGPLPRLLLLLALTETLPQTAVGPAFGAALGDAERDWLARSRHQSAAALPIAKRHSLPDWLAEALQRRLGEDGLDALGAALNQPAPLDLRVNLLRQRREAALEALRADGVAAEATRWSPWGIRVAGKPALQRLAIVQGGGVEVQDEGSQLIALLVGARRGESVADFCAGGGGKTLALGAMMRGAGRLYAMDVAAGRLDGLAQRAARAGLGEVVTLALAHERDARLQRLAGRMDRVLVDAPCTGLGTLRRNPDLKWRQTPEAVADMAARQLDILTAASALVRPGGRLVYATCSLLDAENEAVAEAFGRDHPAFRPQPVQSLLAGAGIPDAAFLSDGASPDGDCGLYLRLWPHRHGCDGFFAAAWQRA